MFRNLVIMDESEVLALTKKQLWIFLQKYFSCKMMLVSEWLIAKFSFFGTIYPNASREFWIPTTADY